MQRHRYPELAELDLQVAVACGVEAAITDVGEQEPHPSGGVTFPKRGWNLWVFLPNPMACPDSEVYAEAERKGQYTRLFGMHVSPLDFWSPTRNWHHAGPLLVQMKGALCTDDKDPVLWACTALRGYGIDEDPRVAIVKCWLMAVQNETVNPKLARDLAEEQDDGSVGC